LYLISIVGGKPVERSIKDIEVISKQWVTAVEDCGYKLPGVPDALAGIKRVGGR